MSYRDCPRCGVPMEPDVAGKYLVCTKDPTHKVKLPDEVK